ncbi:MAG: PIG-L family deacetylase [Elusimicrobiota bacterium]|jgi:hypothetical protein|nr:PIG-L family deacetylase [Elusimicrobiota bacterium]
MIKIIAKIICLAIPFKKLRRTVRKNLTKFMTDKMVDCGKIYYLRDLMIPEFAPLNTLIKPDSRVLIIAPHPDDETIGCGGIMAKYAKSCDCLCVNSSGFKCESDTKSCEEIVNERIIEFNKVMDYFGIRRRWIFKIFGKPPHFDKIMAKEQKYLSTVNFREYTHIFVPDRLDGHREHQFLTKSLF